MKKRMKRIVGMILGVAMLVGTSMTSYAWDPYSNPELLQQLRERDAKRWFEGLNQHSVDYDDVLGLGILSVSHYNDGTTAYEYCTLDDIASMNVYLDDEYVGKVKKVNVNSADPIPYYDKGTHPILKAYYELPSGYDYSNGDVEYEIHGVRGSETLFSYVSHGAWVKTGSGYDYHYRAALVGECGHLSNITPSAGGSSNNEPDDSVAMDGSEFDWCTRYEGMTDENGDGIADGREGNASNPDTDTEEEDSYNPEPDVVWEDDTTDKWYNSDREGYEGFKGADSYYRRDITNTEGLSESLDFENSATVVRWSTNGITDTHWELPDSKLQRTVTTDGGVMETVLTSDITYNYKGEYLVDCWIRDNAVQGWFAVNQDGMLYRECWIKVRGAEYYFGEDGLMDTGWQQIAGNWYYLDPMTGAKWVSTTTPDGYPVNAEGVWVQ